MKCTTHCAYQSRETWLWKCALYIDDCIWWAVLLPSMEAFPQILHLRLQWYCMLKLQLEATQNIDYHSEFIPVHSPLLRKYMFVSFPPLTYMLKLSGFSCLTSCLGRWQTKFINELVNNAHHSRQIQSAHDFSMVENQKKNMHIHHLHELDATIVFAACKPAARTMITQ